MNMLNALRSGQGKPGGWHACKIDGTYNLLVLHVIGDLHTNPSVKLMS